MRGLRSDERTALQFIDRSVDDLVRSRDVAYRVGWEPRTAGARMVSLERRGFVERRIIRRGTFNTDTLYGWKLTARGRREADGV